MEQWIDLHTHSCESDGALSPRDLVLHAKSDGLTAIALTDHDTLSGVEAAMKAAQDAGMELVGGVELSAKFNGEMHILGFYTDPGCEILKAALNTLLAYRKKRNHKMIKALNACGIDVTENEILSQGSGEDLSSMGRLHIAKALIKRGLAESVNDSFNKYLGYGKCAYVPRMRLTPRECIRLIHQAGGLAFLAHPFTVAKTADLKDTLKELISFGLDGMECLYPLHKPDFEKWCLDFCRKHKLLISGGSDFHGENKPTIPIGRVHGGRRIGYELLEKIKERIKENS